MAIYHADSWNPISVITADAWPWDQTNHFNRGPNDVEPGTMDCFRDQWTSSGSKLSWKTINNCFTSNNTFAASDESRQWLATFLWDTGDRMELEWETIDALVRGQSLFTLFYHWPDQPHIMHWNPISHTLWVYSLLYFLELHFFFPEAAIRCNSTFSNICCNKNLRFQKT